MASDHHYSIDAPKTGVAINVNAEDGIPKYAVSFEGTTLVDPSELGLELADAPDLTGPFEVVAADHRADKESWEPVWGADATIEMPYRQLHLQLRETNPPQRVLEITFRVFDEGIGFRYTIPDQEDIREFAIAAERSEFRFAEDFTAWWIPARETGPKPCSWIDTYEKIYTETSLSEMPRVHTPVTIEADECYLALHEAALIDYADMEPAPIEDESHAFESGLVALPDGTKVEGTAPHRSPWRTLLIGEGPGDLIESHVIEALNQPCAIEDPSWIDPGTYVGVWWEIHKGVSTWNYGPDVGANSENMKDYIDFAAEHDIPYVLAEGWNEGWGPDPATTDFARAHDRFDLEEILAYAAERDVEFLAHAETNGNVEAFEADLEEVFAFYEENGIPGVKTGYAGEIAGHHRHDQWMVNHYRRTVRAAADHNLLIDIHEPIKPTGERRTYPNLMTREGVRGMEINASPSLGGGNPPAHTVTLPFTRMIAGPLDYTPGIFEVLWDPSENGTRVHTSRARQLALYPILLSGLQMAADLPTHYEDRPEFAFIEAVPTSWDETQVINAEIGEYVTIARRSGDEWYVGSGTDDSSRTLSIPLDFLDTGTYVAETYSDAPDADIDENPTAVAIHEGLVDASTTIPAPMIDGGGQAIRLRPATEDEAASLPAYEPDWLPAHGE
jgi:hypothetical protein